ARPGAVAAMRGVAVGPVVARWAGRAAEAALLAHGRSRLERPGVAHRLGEIAGQGLDVELLPGQPLDVAQQGPLLVGAESDRNARRARARRSSDAVDILLGD